MMTKQDIVIGKIVAPHGVRGEFRIMPLTDNPEQYNKLKTLRLSDGTILTIEGLRFHKNLILVKVKEVEDMDGAELLRGKEIVLSKSELPPLPEGSYYVSDLVGFKVLSPEGELLGTLKDVITPGSTDVFVITSVAGEEIMVVAIESNIKKIDLAQKQIIAVLPEWME